jgi:hypothetical protein
MLFTIVRAGRTITFRRVVSPVTGEVLYLIVR